MVVNRLIKTLLAITSLVYLSTTAAPEIRYSVTPIADGANLSITIQFESKGTTADLQIPNWAPGSYVLQTYYNNIRDVKATNKAGEELKIEKTDNNTWRVSTEVGNTINFSYTTNARTAHGATHYSGPSTYMYVVGRKEEPCKLQINLPEGWKVAVGLDEVEKEKNTFLADDYDVLADNPVTMGDFLLDTYTVLNKPHYIVCRGVAKDLVDRKELLRYCKEITESQAHFFGGLPYNKFVWHFDVTDRLDGAGGLEHLSSTQISLAAGLGPRTVQVMAHEFFHLWNVKRIRSEPLGPFDYLKLPKTGALWWLEGVTDYYAHLLLSRYAIQDEETFYNDLVANLRSVRNNAARLEVSPHESSFRVGEANNGRGNSNGWRISYYSYGFVVGACLDLEIRARTNGKYSLDNVTLDLWQMCKDNQPGFKEDAIRELCIKYAGPNFAEYYDNLVMKAGEIPIETTLEKVGLKLITTSETFTDIGFQWQPVARDKGSRITRVWGPAQDILKPDDIIKNIEGESLEHEASVSIALAANKAFANASVGSPLKVNVKRGDQIMDLEITPVTGTREVQRIVEMETISESQKTARRNWTKKS